MLETLNCWNLSKDYEYEQNKYWEWVKIEMRRQKIEKYW